ncbi:MAG: PAS domain-containing protein [Thermoleophilia bacterium]|nr:PAS domain-containing protein [Thermoleophilia bacterium]
MTAVAWVIAVVALGLAVWGTISARRARVAAVVATRRAWSAAAEPAGERLATAFAALPVSVLVVDASAVITDVNRRAADVFPLVAPGMGVLEAFGDHLLAGRMRDALRVGDPAEFDLRLYVEGRQTFRVVIVPFDGADGREALLYLRDTSEVTAYQELRSQFVANVSHELRTPLTGMRGMLEALEDPDIPTEVRLDFAHRARLESERLEALIDDVLFLSELEAAQGDPVGARSDMGEIAGVVVGELAAEAVEKGVSVDVEAANGAWTALTDRMARTVVRNLVENAICYAGPGATAVVRVRRVGDMVDVEVVDDGLGIPEKSVPHVFERFYRADPSRSRSVGGTGLGLSIVKHIADRLGGTARLSSREGFGTTVTVSIPAVDPPVTDVPGGRGDAPGTRLRW